MYSIFFLDVTDVSGPLKFWIQFANGQTKFIDAMEANQKWPTMVIEFYENHMHFE